MGLLNMPTPGVREVLSTGGNRFVCYQKERERQLNHVEYLGWTGVEFGFVQDDSSKECLHSSDLVNSNSSWPL